MNVLNVDAKRGIIHVVAYRAPEDRLFFLMLRELKDKPSYNKYAGMLSFPAETAKEFEQGHETVKRLGVEELGRVIDSYDGPLSLMRFPHGISVEVVTTVVSHPFEAKPMETDVAHHGWISEELLRELIKRQGTCRIETQAAYDAAMQLLQEGVYA